MKPGNFHIAVPATEEDSCILLLRSLNLSQQIEVVPIPEGLALSVSPDTDSQIRFAFWQAWKEKDKAFNQKRDTFSIRGMSCAACALSVESLIMALPGIFSVNVNFAANTVFIHWLPTWVGLQEIKAALSSAGYELGPNADQTLSPIQSDSSEQITHKPEWKIAAMLLLAIPPFVFGMFFSTMALGQYISFFCATLTLFWGGQRFYKKAWTMARLRTAGMDTLIVISLSVAWLFSVINLFFPQWIQQLGFQPVFYFETVAVTVAMVYLGKYLEDQSRVKTQSALQLLIRHTSGNVLKRNPDGGFTEITMQDIQQGDILFIQPGAYVPVDGLVLFGTSFVDESMLTGESMPVPKQAGDKVFAGTINQRGGIQVGVDKFGGQTLLADIIRQVEQALGAKTAWQQFADRVSAWFVPAVVTVAVLSFTVWVSIDTAYFSHGLMAFITVLVVACPCALGLATPMALTAGIGRSADRGILIRNAHSLEKLEKADIVVFDKTGTITEGKLALEEAVFYTETDYRPVVKAFAIRHTHPVLKVLLESYADQPDIVLNNYQPDELGGASGQIDGNTFLLGSMRFILAKGISPEKQLIIWVEEKQLQGKNVILLVKHLEVVGCFVSSDRIRSEAKAAVQTLQQMGKTLMILSGDQMGATNNMAQKLGIEQFQHSMLPGQKLEVIQSLQKKGHRVVMIGDGINDGPALAAADVSIAMGQGTDLAIQVADITLFRTGLTAVAEAFSLSAQTIQTIRRNVFLAFLYNVLLIPVAAGALYPLTHTLMHPMLASVFMAFSSFTVIGNSLLLRRA